MDLSCKEQIDQAPEAHDAQEVIATEDDATVLTVPVVTSLKFATIELDPYEAFDLRVQAEARANDRRNPRYVEEIQRHGMTIKWRSRMCRWMFATAHSFEMIQDTVGCGIHFMDQYLSHHSVDHILIQLVAMMSLCIASKMHEHRPMSMREMDLLCENKFTHQQMIAMEAKMLQHLEWALNPAVSFTFARDLRRLALFEPHEQELLDDQATQLLQAASIEYDSISYPSSLLGLAALEVVVNALIPHRRRNVREVTKLLQPVDVDTHFACVEFLKDLFVESCDPRRLASPTSVESESVVAPSSSRVASSDQSTPIKVSSDSNTTSAKRQRVV